ncbi:MAG: hypothetical protein O9972_00360, partial [Burkholderiales bacterium]|nr:hypothetical protein [Burkholderiales bacterium]
RGRHAAGGGAGAPGPPPAPPRAPPPPPGPPGADVWGRRSDGELTPDGRSRVARMTIVGLVLIALLGSGLALVGLAAR